MHRLTRRRSIQLNKKKREIIAETELQMIVGNWVLIVSRWVQTSRGCDICRKNEKRKKKLAFNCKGGKVSEGGFMRQEEVFCDVNRLL